MTIIVIRTVTTAVILTDDGDDSNDDNGTGEGYTTYDRNDKSVTGDSHANDYYNLELLVIMKEGQFISLADYSLTDPKPGIYPQPQ